jgi:hypothetical protein
MDKKFSELKLDQLQAIAGGMRFEAATATASTSMYASAYVAPTASMSGFKLPVVEARR